MISTLSPHSNLALLIICSNLLDEIGLSVCCSERKQHQKDGRRLFCHAQKRPSNRQGRSPGYSCATATESSRSHWPALNAYKVRMITRRFSPRRSNTSSASDCPISKRL